MNEHADRDQSEEPVDLTGFEGAYANAPHAGAGGQGDPVQVRATPAQVVTSALDGAARIVDDWLDDDERLRIPNTEWGVDLHEAVRALVTHAKSDVAEQAEMRAEVERLQRWKTEATEVILGLQDVGKALGLQLGERITGTAATEAAKRLSARTEAAERALADERAKVEAFIGKRPEYVQALKSSPSADADYWRWQGHAEARRQLCSNLDGACRCGWHKDRIAPEATEGCGCLTHPARKLTADGDPTGCYCECTDTAGCDHN